MSFLGTIHLPLREIDEKILHNKFRVQVVLELEFLLSLMETYKWKSVAGEVYVGVLELLQYKLGVCDMTIFVNDQNVCRFVF